MKNIIKYITAMAIVFSIAACQKTEPVSPSTSGSTTTQNNNSNQNNNTGLPTSWFLGFLSEDTTSAIYINGIQFINKNIGLETTSGTLPYGHQGDKIRLITHSKLGWMFCIESKDTFSLKVPWININKVSNNISYISSDKTMDPLYGNPIDTTFVLP